MAEVKVPYDMVKEFRHVALADEGGIEGGLEATLAHIAYRIRAELVCCDIFERTYGTDAWLKASEGKHSICYWGEAAARIAEDPAPCMGGR